MFLRGRRPTAAQRSWTVFPRPMSSARMAPTPSRPRNESQDKPALLVRPQRAGEAVRRLHRTQAAGRPARTAGRRASRRRPPRPAPGRRASPSAPDRRAEHLGRGHRAGPLAFKELQRGLQVPVVEFHPLPADADERNLEPGQLGQLFRGQHLVADCQVVAEVHEVLQAELARPGRRGRAALDEDLAVSFRPSRALRAQSGSSTPNPAPDSSGPVSRRNSSAPAVSSATRAGAASRSAPSSAGNSRAAAPRPGQQFLLGMCVSGQPAESAPSHTSAAGSIRLGSSADWSEKSICQVPAPRSRGASASASSGSAARPGGSRCGPSRLEVRRSPASSRTRPIVPVPRACPRASPPRPQQRSW